MNCAKLKLLPIVFSTAALAVATPVAHGWDGAVSGTITTVDVTGGNNFSLRIALAGVTSMCSSGPAWAYVNEADGNYKSYAAALMLAQAQGRRVTVYSTLVNGYCQIGYISMLPS